MMKMTMESKSRISLRYIRATLFIGYRGGLGPYEQEKLRAITELAITRPRIT